MNTIEETYCIINKQTGRDLGLLIMRSTQEGRGVVGTEFQVLPLGDVPLQSGDYSLSFVKKMMVDATTNTPAAPDEVRREMAEAVEQNRTTFKPHEVNPQRAADAKPRTLAEIKAERDARGATMPKEEAAKAAADFAKATRDAQRGRDRSRDDFER